MNEQTKEEKEEKEKEEKKDLSGPVCPDVWDKQNSHS
jgi:hypothetical protein